MDGDITLRSYEREALADPRVVALMNKVTVSEGQALTALFPHHPSNTVTVTLASGEVLSEAVVSGPGSLETPMTDTQFDAKSRAMAAPHLIKGAQDDALAFAWSLERQRDYDLLFRAMAPPPKDAQAV